MINTDNSLSDEFEKIAQKSLLEKEADEAISQHDIFRYDFATKVAMGEELTIEDMFGYLEGWAKYKIAHLRSKSRVSDDYQKLKSDCEKQEISETIEAHLLKRIYKAKKAVEFAERSSAEFSQQAFLGIPEDSSLVGRASKNVKLELVNEIAWLPFELAGLEKCKMFLDK